MFQQAIAIIGQIIAVFVLVALIEAAKEQYLKDNPGQPGWGVYFLGFGAILVLLGT